MTTPAYQIRQLVDELTPPDSGKQNIVLSDNEKSKVILFTFAAGSGLPEHAAPMHAIIQIVHGEADLTVGDQAVKGQVGTWIQMSPGTLHSIQAVTPLWMLLTLLK